MGKTTVNDKVVDAQIALKKASQTFHKGLSQGIAQQESHRTITLGPIGQGTKERRIKKKDALKNMQEKAANSKIFINDNVYGQVVKAETFKSNEGDWNAMKDILESSDALKYANGENDNEWKQKHPGESHPTSETYNTLYEAMNTIENTYKELAALQNLQDTLNTMDQDVQIWREHEKNDPSALGGNILRAEETSLVNTTVSDEKIDDKYLEIRQPFLEKAATEVDEVKKEIHAVADKIAELNPSSQEFEEKVEDLQIYIEALNGMERAVIDKADFSPDQLEKINDDQEILLNEIESFGSQIKEFGKNINPPSINEDNKSVPRQFTH